MMLRYGITIWFAVTCAYAALADADVVINEVQSSNDGALLDDDGDASDWIELLNRGDEGVSLGGWGLSDRVSNPMKWVMPDFTLGPGDRRLVFASGKDRTNLQEVALGSPQDLPGLVLWLKADAESGTYTNNQPVGVWSDWSGYGNHATQTVVSARPVFVTNAVNGLPALRFTRASSQQLFLPVAGFNGMESLRDFSLFIVCRWGGQATSGLFGAWGSSANSHFEIDNTGGRLRLRVAALDSIRSDGVMTSGAWCQVAGLMNGSGDTPMARIFRDGLLRGEMTRDPGGAALSSHTAMTIGDSDANSRFFGGDIAEVLMFNRALRSSERRAVERLLAARYGLPFLGGALRPELHANFSISAEGETVVLARPGGVTADSVALPALPAGASCGRSPDGTGGFAYFAVPTPDAPNTSVAYGPPVGLPSFSHGRGLYDAPFALSLAHADPAASLYYTLDGSVPATTNGTLYAAPIAVTNTTVVRAIAWKAGALPVRTVATHTYIFLDGVVAQTNRPAGYPADWNGFAHTSYALSPYVSAQPGHAGALRASLRAAPVLAISASVADLFGTGGVYANPTVDGLERGVSAEWLTNGVSQLQVDAALRVQGGASRVFSNTPKKSLRLLFKSAYGDGRLRAPVLAEGGTTLADFNTLILRAEYNNAWTHTDSTQRPRGIYVRDQWVRDTQIAMSGSGSHGTHVHLFLNGLYWGLYNVAERPDAAFAATVFGGAREDYDAMTPDGIRDGSNVSWNAMHALAKAGLATRAQYEAIARYLDIDHLIDYMILNFYAGNSDWPHHNWNAVRLREEGAGYLFYSWDAERTLESVNANVVGATHTSGPAYLHTALCANAEYRLRFADRIHRSLFNGGPLTPARAAASFDALAATAEPLIYAEAARWGAYRNEVTPGGVQRYGTNDWAVERLRLRTVWFPTRTGNMMNQFRNASPSLYPQVDAPEFSQHGGMVPHGATIAVTAAQGSIYVTFDGTDPREAYTGAVATNATAYAAPFAVTGKWVVKARALHNGTWSALTEAAFSPPPPDYTALRVAEFMYAPNGGDNHAWMDLVNTSTQPLDLSGISFIPTGATEAAVQWTAPEGLIVPGGGHVILVKNAANFAERHTVPPGTPVYTYGKNFSRSSEPVTFGDPSGRPFFSFTYTRDWYPETYNTGRSLVAVDCLAPEPLWSTAANWRPSTVLNGTPAASETPALTTFTVTPSDLQDGVVTFNVNGLEWGFTVMWSTDLATWHTCPPVTITAAHPLLRVTLPPAARDAQRCFFKVVNP